MIRRKKVTYCSWFLSTISFFLDKVEFTALVSPPADPKRPVFIAGQPSPPSDPAPPPCNQAPVASSSNTASLKPFQPIAPAAPAAKPRPPVPAALDRDAAERQAQLRHAPREAAAERPTRDWATSEDVIHLRLAAQEQLARDWATSEEDVIHLHLGD